MEFDTSLTNEKIKKNFDSQFDMVNYLIGKAQDMIATGRAPRIRTNSDNVAVNVVAEVMEGKDKADHFDYIEESIVVNEVPVEEGVFENS